MPITELSQSSLRIGVRPNLPPVAAIAPVRAIRDEPHATVSISDAALKAATEAGVVNQYLSRDRAASDTLASDPFSGEALTRVALASAAYIVDAQYASRLLQPPPRDSSSVPFAVVDLRLGGGTPLNALRADAVAPVATLGDARLGGRSGLLFATFDDAAFDAPRPGVARAKPTRSAYNRFDDERTPGATVSVYA